jgi:hypothetical protein
MKSGSMALSGSATGSQHQGVSTTYAVLVIGAGVLANLLIAGMFVARVHAPAWARAIGFAGTAMAIPLAIASVLALVDGAGAWAVVLPLVFVAFAVIEVLGDVVLEGGFRTSRWLGPYLASFYLAQWALVGAAFLASRTGGFVVLFTYFVCLAATFYAYRRVGHATPV